MGYGYGSGFGSSTGSNALMGGIASFGTWMVLGFIAFIAAIVVTVILYKKFLKDPNAVRVPGQKRDWGPFFRFEDLIIEKIMQVLFMFIAILVAFESAAAAVAALLLIITAPGMAIGLILLIAILFVVFEVSNRIGFEMTMLTILIWKNTSELRKSVCGDTFARPVAASPVAGVPTQPAAAPAVAAASAQPTAPAAPASTPAQPAAQPTAPIPTQGAPESSWVCPKCGTPNKPGKFCAHCGAKHE